MILYLLKFQLSNLHWCQNGVFIIWWINWCATQCISNLIFGAFSVLDFHVKLLQLKCPSCQTSSWFLLTHKPLQCLVICFYNKRCVFNIHSEFSYSVNDCKTFFVRCRIV